MSSPASDALQTALAQVIDPELRRNGDAAFSLLLETIRRGQADGRIRKGNPVELAEVVWALSHGIATLGMAQQLPEAALVGELGAD